MRENDTQNRVSRLVSLNDDVRDRLLELKEQFPNCNDIAYRGSALVNILRFEESDEHPNDGMLMFVYRYRHDTDTYRLECHMEVNYRTVEDHNDRIQFVVDEKDEVEPLSFVDRKIEQFLELYEDPPETYAP